jgi:prepilin-type processing-associated H-X9-DG protein
MKPSRIMTVANSNHPGGVNLLRSDGSVRFLREGMSIRTLAALGTRGGGEVIPDDF